MGHNHLILLTHIFVLLHCFVPNAGVGELLSLCSFVHIHICPSQAKPQTPLTTFRRGVSHHCSATNTGQIKVTHLWAQRWTASFLGDDTLTLCFCCSQGDGLIMGVYKTGVTTWKGCYL